jgi:hypothetical protein
VEWLGPSGLPLKDVTEIPAWSIHKVPVTTLIKRLACLLKTTLKHTTINYEAVQCASTLSILFSFVSTPKALNKILQLVLKLTGSAHF